MKRKASLSKEWKGKIKLKDGPRFPTCYCCNNSFGPIHFNKVKKLIHRYIRRVEDQHLKEEIEEELDE